MPSKLRHNKQTKKESQVHRLAFFVLKIAWIIVVFAWLSFTLRMSFDTYHNISLGFAQAIGKPSHTELLRTQYFPPALLPVLRVFCWLVLAGLLFTYRYLSRLSHFLLAFAVVGLQLMLMCFRSIAACSKPQKLALLIGSLTIFGSRIYYAWLFPLQYDEAFAYVHLISKGLLVSAVYYPGPNNHILFSNIASVLHLVLPPLVAMRLPVIISSLLSWYLLWDWLHTRVRFEWALLVALLVFFFPLMGIYNVMGRGYSLQFLFALIACRAILAPAYQLLHRRAFVVSSVFGFYLVPTFLYWFVTLAIYKTGQFVLTKENKQVLKQWAKDLGIISLLTALLYSPVIAANGLNALINNGWVSSIGFEQWRAQFPAYLAALGNALWGEPWGQWVGLSYGLLVVIFFIRYPRKGTFVFLSLCLPLLMNILQGVLPPYRIWLYWLLPFSWFMALLTQKIGKIKLITSIMLSIILLFYIITTTQQFQKIARLPHPHIRMAKKISKLPNPQNILVNHDTYMVFLQYMSLGKKHKIDVKLNNNMRYDWLILKKPTGQKYKEYKIIFEDREVVIYHSRAISNF